ncbi:unnamed protein product [Ceutorhynchus assimilis]|uniref:Gamma-interferon-inducible lysosomal thiol reductase n=1 Tax=Ceutorhynchus assimilis TaxID=467358 RepID=A0A9N9MVG6_9CUCU|nr:unnamed protein product [Ceutorhynchus assimilis]
MKLLKFCAYVLLFVKCVLAVKISVYYECLCPDSIAFIRDQLHPNYQTFGDKLIKLELIPYGFAKEHIENGTKTFTCQHGPKECYGNEVHGCVINEVSIDKSENFIFCAENGTPPSSKDILKSCAEQQEISWASLQKCALSEQGADIMSKNGKKTKELNPTFIPTIVFNDVLNIDDTNKSITDLKSVICKYLENKPEQCQSLKRLSDDSQIVPHVTQIV